MVGAPSWEVTPLHGFPGDMCPVEPGEAVVLLICAFPIQGRTGQECAKQFPQCGFSAQKSLPGERRKGFLSGCFVMGQLGLV